MKLLRLPTLLLGTLLSACAVRIPPPDPPSGPSGARADPNANWAEVLERHVDQRGAIDFDAMAADPAALEAYVEWIARVSPRSAPEQFSDANAVVAYYVNAYNALAMYDVLRSGVLPESKYQFFYRRRLLIGGEWRSLYHLEKDVIRPLGEERVHFALNCMVRSCPRLPRVPFGAAELDAQLDAAAREFLNDERHVLVKPAEGRVELSVILDWYEEDFLAVAPSLIAYVNRYRDEPIDAEFEVGFLPYDWTLNQSPQP